MKLAEQILSILATVGRLIADLIAEGAKNEAAAEASAAALMERLGAHQSEREARQRVRRAAEDAEVATFPRAVHADAPAPLPTPPADDAPAGVAGLPSAPDDPFPNGATAGDE